jgi:hypothetical protein
MVVSCRQCGAKVTGEACSACGEKLEGGMQFKPGNEKEREGEGQRMEERREERIREQGDKER